MKRDEIVIANAKQVHIEPNGQGGIDVWIVPESQTNVMKNVSVQEREI